MKSRLALMMSGCITICAMSVLAQTTKPADLPRLRVQGQTLVDPAGNQVILRGTNLGNWLLIEPGGLGNSLGRWPDQHTLFTILRDRFGEAERRRLIEIYRENYIVERDFELAKSFNFNFLRVGFDYELFEDDSNPKQLRQDAFKYTDRAVQLAKKHGMYVLFDLHGAQERQVDGKQSGRNGYNKFWDDPAAQDRSLWLWEQVIGRYKGEPTVIGYEALNEPWGKSKAALRGYCERWYEVVRKIDPEAICVFPGWYADIGFYRKPREAGYTNMMFDVHFYPGYFGSGQPDVKSNRDFLHNELTRWRMIMDAYDAPLLIGEINNVSKRSGGGEMLRRYYDFAAERGWPMTMWTLKELRTRGGVGEEMWMLVTNRDPLEPVDVRTASLEQIEAFMRSLGTMPLIADPDTLHWLTTDESPAPLE